jgi:hypothetical protein
MPSEFKYVSVTVEVPDFLHEWLQTDEAHRFLTNKQTAMDGDRPIIPNIPRTVEGCALWAMLYAHVREQEASNPKPPPINPQGDDCPF